jgi:hypothetical protein
MDDKELRQQYLKQLLSEYVALAERNESVEEFDRIHHAIRAARKKISK